MNYNRNEQGFNYLSNWLSQPEKREALRAEFDKKRMGAVQQAIAHRLVLIPLTVTLSLTGRVQSYNAKSQPLNDDLIVIGYMTDNGNRDIILQKAEKEKPLVYVGDASDLYLTGADVAGQPQNTNPKGQKGIFFLPNPKLFYKTETISLDVFKTDDTENNEVVKFVVVAYKVLPFQIAQAYFAAENTIIKEYIAKRTAPETLFLKNRVIFDTADSNGYAEIFTPQLDEPVILRGVRSSMNNASVILNLEGDAPLMLDKTPIWAVAHGDEIPHENYLWNQRGLYIPAKTQLRGKFYNDGQSLDVQGNDDDNKNTITWCISTV